MMADSRIPKVANWMEDVTPRRAISNFLDNATPKDSPDINTLAQVPQESPVVDGSPILPSSQASQRSSKKRKLVDGDQSASSSKRNIVEETFQGDGDTLGISDIPSRLETPPPKRPNLKPSKRTSTSVFKQLLEKTTKSSVQASQDPSLSESSLGDLNIPASLDSPDAKRRSRPKSKRASGAAFKKVIEETVRPRKADEPASDSVSDDSMIPSTLESPPKMSSRPIPKPNQDSDTSFLRALETAVPKVIVQPVTMEAPVPNVLYQSTTEAGDSDQELLRDRNLYAAVIPETGEEEQLITPDTMTSPANQSAPSASILTQVDIGPLALQNDEPHQVESVEPEIEPPMYVSTNMATDAESPAVVEVDVFEQVSVQVRPSAPTEIDSLSISNIPQELDSVEDVGRYRPGLKDKQRPSMSADFMAVLSQRKIPEAEIEAAKSAPTRQSIRPVAIDSSSDTPVVPVVFPDQETFSKTSDTDGPGTLTGDSTGSRPSNVSATTAPTSKTGEVEFTSEESLSSSGSSAARNRSKKSLNFGAPSPKQISEIIHSLAQEPIADVPEKKLEPQGPPQMAERISSPEDEFYSPPESAPGEDDLTEDEDLVEMDENELQPPQTEAAGAPDDKTPARPFRKNSTVIAGGMSFSEPALSMSPISEATDAREAPPGGLQSTPAPPRQRRRSVPQSPMYMSVMQKNLQKNRMEIRDSVAQIPPTVPESQEEPIELPEVGASPTVAELSAGATPKKVEKVESEPSLVPGIAAKVSTIQETPRKSQEVPSRTEIASAAPGSLADLEATPSGSGLRDTAASYVSSRTPASSSGVKATPTSSPGPGATPTFRTEWKTTPIAPGRPSGTKGLASANASKGKSFVSRLEAEESDESESDWEEAAQEVPKKLPPLPIHVAFEALPDRSHDLVPIEIRLKNNAKFQAKVQQQREKLAAEKAAKQVPKAKAVRRAGKGANKRVETMTSFPTNKGNLKFYSQFKVTNEACETFHQLVDNWMDFTLNQLANFLADEGKDSLETKEDALKMLQRQGLVKNYWEHSGLCHDLLTYDESDRLLATEWPANKHLPKSQQAKKSATTSTEAKKSSKSKS